MPIEQFSPSLEQTDLEKTDEKTLRQRLIDKYLDEECKIKHPGEECGLKFIDDNLKIPEAIDLKKLKSVNMPDKLANELIDKIIKYLLKPRIVDSFDSHERRREWRRELDDSLLKIFKDNKFRINSMTPVFSTLELFYEKETDMNLKDKIAELIGQFPEEIKPKEVDPEEINRIRAGLITPVEAGKPENKSYDALDLEKKNEIVNQVNDISIRFLNLFK